MGRPKGAQNKTTRAFKDAVLQTFQRLGGVTALTKWAQKNETDFYKICGRLIPHEVVGPGAQGEHVARLIVELHPDGPPKGEDKP